MLLTRPLIHSNISVEFTGIAVAEDSVLMTGLLAVVGTEGLIFI